MKKTAVITMDVEDWYHTGYLDRNQCDRSVSILHYLEKFCDQVEEYGGRATLFVLGELVPQLAPRLNALAARGHEIASHAWSHTPLMQLSFEDFEREIHDCVRVHGDYISSPLLGFRAPLFNLDAHRLDSVFASGFQYDSSSTARGRSSSQIDLSEFDILRKQIYCRDGRLEFQVGAAGYSSYFINGGGGTRILPWSASRMLLRSFLRENEYYNFFVHPLDLSREELPVPASLSWMARQRMLFGRERMETRLNLILEELRMAGYQIRTFSEFRTDLLAKVKISA